VELRAERSLVWNKFPVAIDLTSVFNTNSEFSLIIDEDISNVLFWKRKLSLWSFTLSSHVQGKSFFWASGIAERCAWVVIWTLWLEGNTASDFSVWPDLSLKRLNCENLILEKHWIIFNCLSDSLVLSRQSSNGFFLSSLILLIELLIIVGVIRVETIVIIIYLTVLEKSFFFWFFLAELIIESILFLVFLFVCGESSPREFDWNLTLVHDGVVLVWIQSNTSWIHVNMALAEVYIVIMRLALNWDACFKVIVR